MIVFMGLKFEEFCKCARFCLRKAFPGGLLSQMYEINARSADRFTLEICTPAYF